MKTQTRIFKIDKLISNIAVLLFTSVGYDNDATGYHMIHMYFIIKIILYLLIPTPL